MATISKLKPGQILYTVTRGRLGNTTLRTVRVHDVKIIEVDPDGKFVVASWNGNRSEKYHRGDVSTWKVSKPVTIEGMFGSERLASKAEKAEILAKHAEPQRG